MKGSSRRALDKVMEIILGVMEVCIQAIG